MPELMEENARVWRLFLMASKQLSVMPDIQIIIEIAKAMRIKINMCLFEKIEAIENTVLSETKDQKVTAGNECQR